MSLQQVNTIAQENINLPLVTMFVKFPVPLTERADRIEVWGTTFDNEGDNEGPDYCEFRLMKGNQILAKQIVNGY